MKNQTLMQYFEWYLPHDGNHWTRLAEQQMKRMLVMASMTYLTLENLIRKVLYVPNMVLKKTIFMPSKF